MKIILREKYVVKHKNFKREQLLGQKDSTGAKLNTS